MNKAEVTAFLQCLNAKKLSFNNRWVTCSCPLAPWNHDTGADKTPSFAVRIVENGYSYFHCFVCESGKLADLVLILKHKKAELDLAGAWKFIEAEDAKKLSLSIHDWDQGIIGPVQDVVIPEEWLGKFPKAWPVDRAREYLQTRAVNAHVAAAMDIRWDWSRKTVCFPIRNFSGELVSLRGRYIVPMGAPYHVYPFLGQTGGQAWWGEHQVDFDQSVLMVESVFDVASCLRVYGNILAPLSVGINDKRIKRVGQATEVITFFDQGKGGDKARAIVSQHMGSAMVIHKTPPEKDPGECTVMQLVAALQECLKLEFMAPAI